MDCRKLLLPALWLVGGVVGCHQVATVPSTSTTQPYANASPPAPPAEVQVRKAADLPKQPPRASTCVALSDFFAREANAPGRTQPEQANLRDKARVEYQQALSIDPNCLLAYFGLAKLYLDMGDYDHALATYQKALKGHAKNASIWFELGMCHSRQKQWDKGIEALAKAVELDPENRLYVNTLGFAQARAGRYEESLASFQRVNSEGQAHYRLAQMLQHVQQPVLCKYHLQVALQKDPRLEAAQKMLDQMEGRPSAPVQTVSYVEGAKKAAPEAPPEGVPVVPPGSQAAPDNQPAFSGNQPVMLPPPPGSGSR
jgi:tetratricopeptide (TPR) repeat protein